MPIEQICTLRMEVLIPTPLRVLILEDQPADAELMLHELRQAGFDPEWQRVETEEEYLAALSPDLGLILADYSLPQFDARRALNLLQGRGLDIPFIVITGSISEEVAVECIKQGATDYLLKDRLTRIGQAVTHALDQKRLRDERKQAEEALRLMSDTQREITYLDSLTDIYHLIGKKIQELTGDGYVAVSTIDRQIQAVKVFEVYGFEKIHDMLIRTFGLDPFKAVYYLKDMTECQIRQFTSGKLERYENGLFGILTGKVPKPICEGIERLIGVTDIYTMGFAWEDTLFGGITIFSKHDLTPRRDTIETIMNQVAVAMKRISAEEALRESEEKFKTLFNSANDAIFTMNHTTFLDCNTVTEKIFRSSRDQIVGHSPVEFSPERQPDGSLSSESAVKRIEAAFAGEPQFFEWLHTHLDGTPFYADVSLNRVFIGGEFILQAIVRDITERKRAEEALRASKLIIEGIINAIPVRVFWKDKNLVYLGCNAAFARDKGFTDPKEVIGKDDYQMARRDQAELYRGDDRQVIESGSSKLFVEEPQTTPEGNIITLLTSKVPLRSSQGEVVGVIGTYMDITERKQSEAALREADKRAIRDYEYLLERLTHLAKAVGTAHDLTSVFRGLREFAEASVPCNGLFVSLYNPERQERICVYSGGDGEEDDVSTLPPLPMSDSPQSQAIATAQIVVTDDFQAAVAGKPVVTLGVEQDPRLPQSSLAVPMTVLGRVIGAFEIQSVEPAAYKPEHVTAMHMAANLAAIATENVQMLERERELRLGAEMSEERYRTLAEAAQDTIFIIGRDDRVEYVNSFAAGQFGSRAEELIGKTRAALFPPHVVEEQSRSLQEVFETGNSIYAEAKTVYPTGEVWIGTRLAPIRNVAGGVRAVLGIARDITERKQAEEALRRNEALLLQTGKMAKVGGWELDLPTMTLLWSLETYRIHEVDPSFQPDLENAINFYAPEARPIINEAVRRASEEGRPFDLELPFMTAKGRHIWVRAIGQPEFRDGRCVRLFGAFQDITERKQSEETLRKKEEHHKAVIESIFKFVPEGVLVLTESLNLLEHNKAFDDIVQKYAPLLGYPEQELAEKIIEQLRSKILSGDTTEIHIPKQSQ